MPEPTQHHDRLGGRRVIVTGAGSRPNGVGTGRAIATLFAREGARLALLDNDRGRAEATRAHLPEGSADIVIADLSDMAACAEAVSEAAAGLGGVDILVNNLGRGAGGGRIEAISPEDWRAVFAVNIDSCFAVTRAALPHLLAATDPAIVNIASVAGLRAHGSGSYGASKAAMIQFTAELAVTYGRQGLRANAIAPGHIYTPVVGAASAEARQRRRDIAPLGIEGDAWDIASAALFLSSTEARFITGHCLPVDGGLMATAPLAAADLLRP